MENQREINGWLVAWEVMDYDGDGEERVAARFKDPWKAAAYCCEHDCAAVQLALFKPEFNLPNQD